MGYGKEQGVTMGTLLGLGLVVRLAIAYWLPVGFDEAYYFLYSRHLHWSYFDHPPVVALTTGLGWWLTGWVSPFTLRLGAVLTYTLSLVLLYQLGRHLFSSAVGRTAVALASVMPLLVLGFGVLTSPDNGLILFWTAALWVAAQEFFPQAVAPAAPSAYRPTWRLGLVGVLVGLACLSKYHGFLLGLGLALFCLASPPYRRVFRSPWLGVALVGFGFSLLPLWVWNAQHDWISFRFQLLLRFEGGEPTPFNGLQMVGYWLISVVYLFPPLGFPLWWVTARASWNQVSQHLRRLRGRPASLDYRQGLILWVSLPIALGFTVLGGKQQIFPAWPAPGLWGLTLLLAVAVQRWPRRWVGRWLGGSAWVLGGLVMVALLHLNVGLLQKAGTYAPLGGLVPIKADASTELIDVGQLRRQLAANPEAMALLSEASFVFTNEYYLAGYLDMAIYPLQSLPVIAFSQDPRGLAFWFDQTEWLGRDAVYITLDRFVADRAITEGYGPLFETLDPVTVVETRRGGAVSERFHLYSAQGLQRPYEFPY